MYCSISSQKETQRISVQSSTTCKALLTWYRTSKSFFFAMETSNTSTPTHISLTFKPTTKVSSTNYALWKSQIVPLLRSYNLFRFVGESFQCPVMYLWRSAAPATLLSASTSDTSSTDADASDLGKSRSSYSFMVICCFNTMSFSGA